MELWFWLAVAMAVLGGIPPFLLKVVAKRNYDPGLFMFVGSVVFLLLTIPIVLFLTDSSEFVLVPVLLGAVVGMVNISASLLRTRALQVLDATVYFPLTETLAPVVAIILGITLFNETFTNLEWIGLTVGVFVPLLMLTRQEQHRQVDLQAGLVLVVVTGVLFAGISALNKFNTSLAPDATWWILIGYAVGSLLASMLQLLATRERRHQLLQSLHTAEVGLYSLGAFRGLVGMSAFGCALFAYTLNGPLGIVSTIGATYILIPIILSIIIYHEHWNWQKVVAIVFSVASLALLG